MSLKLKVVCYAAIVNNKVVFCVLFLLGGKGLNGK